MYETLFKKILDERGLSYNIVSRMTGIPKSTLANYANGNRTPDIKTAILIIKSLQLDIGIIESLFEPVF